MKKYYTQNYGDNKDWWICMVSVIPIFLLAAGIWYKALFVPVTCKTDDLIRYTYGDPNWHPSPHSPSEAELLLSVGRKMNEGLQDQLTLEEKAALENEKARRAKQIEKESY
jgi:hypothetical protein